MSETLRRLYLEKVRKNMKNGMDSFVDPRGLYSDMDDPYIPNQKDFYNTYRFEPFRDMVSRKVFEINEQLIYHYLWDKIQNIAGGPLSLDHDGNPIEMKHKMLGQWPLSRFYEDDVSPLTKEINKHIENIYHPMENVYLYMPVLLKEAHDNSVVLYTRGYNGDTDTE